MTNRTALPISTSETQQFSDLGRITKQLRRAFLAKVNGHIMVQPNGNPGDITHYGLYWIKFAEGVDGDGNTIYSQPQRALNKALVPLREGTPIMVYQSYTGGWIISEMDHEAANRGGYDTRQLNLQDGRNKFIALRQIQNMRGITQTVPNATSTTVSIQSLFFQWEGQFKNALKNQQELSSYIPGSGLERLVLLGIRPHDNTLQVISGDTRSQSPTKYALSDTDALVAQLHDYTMPVQAYLLADAQTTITEADVAFDARQFVNVQQPRGAPTKISRHTLYLDGYQDQVFGSCEVLPGGSLEVRPGGGFLVI